MDVTKYFQSLSLELDAMKDRVRNIIGGSHWPTDGEWKESVLRTILRRHLPGTVKVGRGFVIKPGHPSKQIDVLIYDDSKPILYQDGDLVMVTTDAVKGIIEVKSNIGISDFSKITKKLADNAEFILKDRPGNPSIFVGLFSYDSQITMNHSERILSDIQTTAKQDRNRIINHFSLGESLFVRFWDSSPYGNSNYDKWHSYLLERKAAGYFINNVVDAVVNDSVYLNQDVWFPAEGKENKMLDSISL